MSAIYEKFVSWYLRFNGYFTIDNFVVHAADDPNRIRNGIIAPHTETDTIALRMPYSVEIAGNLRIANHEILVEGQNGRFDVVIAEVKSGNDNRPNRVWRNKNLAPIKYIVRFVGLYDECQITNVASQLATHYCYENERSRIRYIVFASEPNQHYLGQGVKYITFSQIAEFLVEIRGQCWIRSGIGVTSIHYQWDEQINKIFTMANDFEKPLPERRSAILEFLVSESQKTG
ncbi:hypothetical protein [Roseiflexus castenholzii]|jgi:hypothetical protein|uniref:Uncharacterized protein n=1 Tax=Roseiflexus castenholzii (strain DSM 13941 / HLO8) TaxID=383372 RepID=A7NS71_ROSCS|nr:hypothetical protein [Roseiflexus castenholzii]ABU60417.1 hypothetical protein Rcas_4399 [Roseiflexus castenholzii DSM 13941]